MQDGKKKALKDLILTDDVKVAFDSFSQYENILDQFVVYKESAMKEAFRKVKPTYSKFYFKGLHLSDLDERVGEPITDIKELIHASDEQQDKFFEVYLEEIYKVSPFKVERGVCPYAKVEQLYSVASAKLMEVLQPINGINPKILDYQSTKNYLKFISLIFREQF
ncbi:hypothetical protein [Pseudoalteromonas luteoviolacea]|uniref:Uncharacterized protein n=1 Tax=Pseudoalteromonas luteoviolacea S4060-1 TaxID=1365257 RepID=A0A167KWH5_9GAMM|nr:hypothetical protein [Pseudoalteromonas luteoviolacea]KZN63401.1 hypothetical protein N478_03870 [Pseudoalteromonas luteoviolacea S4060-1]